MSPLSVLTDIHCDVSSATLSDVGGQADLEDGHLPIDLSYVP